MSGADPVAPDESERGSRSGPRCADGRRARRRRAQLWLWGLSAYGMVLGCGAIALGTALPASEDARLVGLARLDERLAELERRERERQDALAEVRSAIAVREHAEAQPSWSPALHEVMHAADARIRIERIAVPNGADGSSPPMTVDGVGATPLAAKSFAARLETANRLAGVVLRTLEPARDGASETRFRIELRAAGDAGADR